MAAQPNMELLAHRIERLWAGLKRTGPVAVDAIPPEVWRTDKLLCLWHDFSGGESNAEIRELLTQIVYKVAHIKDPLKKLLKERGRDPNTVERFIDNSHALKIIIDGANIEKHGRPRDRPSRSGLDPYLDEVSRPLILQTGSEKGSSVIYTMNPSTGQSKITTTGGGSGFVKYRGEVRDKDSKLIGDILEFAVDATADWVRLFSDLGIPLA